MSDGNNQEGAATKELNRGWFRRERERIAVGRKPMARLLGTTESKLTTLELRKQDVPPQWLGVLAELGFRVPELALGGLPNLSAAEADAAVTALFDEIPEPTPSATAESTVRESGPGSSLACMSVADAMRIRAEADAARAKLATSEPAIASPVRSPSTVKADSDGSTSPQVTSDSQPTEAKRTAASARGHQVKRVAATRRD